VSLGILVVAAKLPVFETEKTIADSVETDLRVGWRPVRFRWRLFVRLTCAIFDVAFAVSGETEDINSKRLRVSA
jgi:hypothetical protein